MSPRLGYYVRPAGPATAPGRIVSLSVASTETAGQDERKPSWSAQFGRVHAAHASYRSGVWTAPQETVYGDTDAFWGWLESEEWGKKPITIVAPDAGASFVLLRGWARVDAAGAIWCGRSCCGASSAEISCAATAYQWRRLIHTHRISILGYSVRGRRYQWVSLANYLSLSPEMLGMIAGLTMVGPSPSSASAGVVGPDYALTARRNLLCMERLIDWWRTVDGGPWASTLAGLGWSYLRRRLAPRTLCVHNDESIRKLEREACHGARVSTWFVGDIRPRTRIGGLRTPEPPRAAHPPIDGPIYSVDVSAMYGSLLLSERFPLRLLSHLRQPTVADLADLLPTTCVIARVSLQTETPEYPVRRQHDVVYPVGRFTTTLAGPDLDRALCSGAITAVHDCAVYQAGHPFTQAATELLAARAGSGPASGTVGQSVAKLMLNSITGRLAVRGSAWIPTPDATPPLVPGVREMDTAIGMGGTLVLAPLRWGDWIGGKPGEVQSVVGGDGSDHNRGTGSPSPGRTVTRYRTLAGLTWRYDRADLGIGTLQACYAYLTSYGRVMMRRIRELLPPQTVLMQDTDGLWVTQRGYDELLKQSGLFGSEPGTLRTDSVIRMARIWDAKHYWADGSWVLGGFSGPAYTGHGLQFVDNQTANPLASQPGHAPVTVHRYARTATLGAIPPGGTVDLGGWIHPYRLPARPPSPESV